MKIYKKIDTNDKWTSKENIAGIKKDTSATQSIFVSMFFGYLTGPAYFFWSLVKTTKAQEESIKNTLQTHDL